MSFLGKLFKKKPGGSFFGNLLRKVGGAVTGGILGGGKGIVPSEFDLDGNGKFSDDEIAIYKEYKKTGKLPSFSFDSHGDPSAGGSASSDTGSDSTGGNAWDSFLNGIGDLKDVFKDVKPKAEVGVDKGTKTLVIGVAVAIIAAILLAPKRR